MITSPCGAAREARRELNAEAESEEGKLLSSFDEEYERQLAEARARATARGRGDVLDYLHLKAANDTNYGLSAGIFTGTATATLFERTQPIAYARFVPAAATYPRIDKTVDALLAPDFPVDRVVLIEHRE